MNSTSFTSWIFNSGVERELGQRGRNDTDHYGNSTPSIMEYTRSEEVENCEVENGFGGNNINKGIPCSCCWNFLSMKKFGGHAGNYNGDHRRNIHAVKW